MQSIVPHPALLKRPFPRLERPQCPEAPGYQTQWTVTYQLLQRHCTMWAPSSFQKVSWLSLRGPAFFWVFSLVPGSSSVHCGLYRYPRLGFFSCNWDKKHPPANTTEWRKDLFWLGVQGYRTTWLIRNGSKSLRQLLRSHPHPGKSSAGTQITFSSLYNPGLMHRKWSCPRLSGFSSNN